ncbi:hypothetical protein [uncultured Brevundimonas sp.]|tara:strand:- start:907 stop:1089 length:183 start_codon:yes stop_codon:yes gene_type:complete
MSDPGVGGIIIEKVRNGLYLKVSAIHVATGREACAVGPAAEPKAVERLAIAKLKRALTQA